jgi:hypothetical protein
MTIVITDTNMENEILLNISLRYFNLFGSFRKSLRHIAPCTSKSKLNNKAANIEREVISKGITPSEIFGKKIRVITETIAGNI